MRDVCLNSGRAPDSDLALLDRRLYGWCTGCARWMRVTHGSPYAARRAEVFFPHAAAPRSRDSAQHAAAIARRIHAGRNEGRLQPSSAYRITQHVLRRAGLPVPETRAEQRRVRRDDC